MRWRALGLTGAAGVLLCACSTVSAKSATTSWAKSSSFAQGAVDLRYDYARVRDAISRNDSTTTVRTYCAEMFSDANGENTDLLPTPDAQLTSLLSSAIDQLIHAAYQCMRDPGSTSVRHATVREARLGVGGVVTAVLREEAVTGRSAGVQGIP
jgi:hypothetical protein